MIMNRFQLIVSFFLIGIVSYGQNLSHCDNIFKRPEVEAKYTNGFPDLMNYFSQNLASIVGDSMRENKTMIDRLYMNLLINDEGTVIAVEFTKPELSEKCKIKLRKEIMTMKGWTPGKIGKINVCTEYIWAISCIKWG